MMQLTLDLSPMLVNRTAVYNICIDVDRIVGARHSVQVDYQFIGWRTPGIPPAGEQRKLHDLFLQKLNELDRLTEARSDSVPTDDRGFEKRRTFYLDPLYTLFASLGTDDIIMCYDLSPITHPHWHNPNVSRLYDSAFCKIVRSGCKVVAVSSE